VIHVDRVPGDHAKALEAIDAALDRRRGQADALGDVGEGSARVALEQLEDLQVGAVQVVRHVATVAHARNERERRDLASDLA
jgi:hypothetical protein